MPDTGKVFMLDDDVIILDMYRSMLESRGYEVFATTNAYQYLMYAKEIVPDIFILDINMPEMNGWEVLERLAQENRLEKTPVMMMTVVSDYDLAVQKGVSHFLHKPVDPQLFTDIIEAYARGNKHHDVLLLEDYELWDENKNERCRGQKWSCFDVHNIIGARKYLSRNHPRMICVRKAPEEFEIICRQLDHENIRRIDLLREIDKFFEE